MSLKRQPGRPPLYAPDAKPAAVHLKLPASDYDSAYRMARERRESVQSVIRRGLKRLLNEDRGGQPVGGSGSGFGNPK